MKSVSYKDLFNSKPKVKSFRSNIHALKSKIMYRRNSSQQPVTPDNLIYDSPRVENNESERYITETFDFMTPKKSTQKRTISFYDSDDLFALTECEIAFSKKHLEQNEKKKEVDLMNTTTTLLSSINKPMQPLMDSTPEDIFWTASDQLLGFSFEKKNPLKPIRLGTEPDIEDGFMTERTLCDTIQSQNTESIRYGSEIGDSSRLYKATAASAAKTVNMQRCQSEPKTSWTKKKTIPIDPPLQCAKRADRWNNVLLPAKILKQRAIERMEERRKKMEEERMEKLMKVVRASLVHVPLEMPDFSNVFKPDLSKSKPVTKPSSPNFASKKLNKKFANNDRNIRRYKLKS